MPWILRQCVLPRLGCRHHQHTSAHCHHSSGVHNWPQHLLSGLALCDIKTSKHISTQTKLVTTSGLILKKNKNNNTKKGEEKKKKRKRKEKNIFIYIFIYFLKKRTTCIQSFVHQWCTTWDNIWCPIWPDAKPSTTHTLRLGHWPGHQPMHQTSIAAHMTLKHQSTFPPATTSSLAN